MTLLSNTFAKDSGFRESLSTAACLPSVLLISFFQVVQANKLFGAAASQTFLSLPLPFFLSLASTGSVSSAGQHAVVHFPSSDVGIQGVV